nr:PREDICTED: activating transcription factor 7-interacting protein 2 isoform X2 [Lepisosteus oculatus]
MPKRKICYSENSNKQPRHPVMENARLLRGRRISLVEMHELIKQETNAVSKLSESKMEELMERIQKVNCRPTHEILINKMQAKINRIKKRLQDALSAVIRTRSVNPTVSPAFVPDKQVSSNLSAPSTLDRCVPCTGPAQALVSQASGTRPTSSPDCITISGTPKAQKHGRTSCETVSAECVVAVDSDSEKENEVMFCGVIPSKRLTGSVAQKQTWRSSDLGFTDFTAETVAADSMQASDAESTGMFQIEIQDYAGRPDPLPSDQAPEADPSNPIQSRTMFPERLKACSVNSTVTQELTAQISEYLGSAVTSYPKSAGLPDQPIEAANGSTHQGCGQPSAPGNIEVNASKFTVTNLLPFQDPLQSQFPPLPETAFPLNLPSIAARTNLPQKLELKVARIRNPKGIGVLWNVAHVDPKAAPVHSYYLYVLHEDLNGCMSSWKNIGIISALPLPMACKLNRCAPQRRYYFAIVGKDIYGRCGPYSEVCSVTVHDM